MRLANINPTAGNTLSTEEFAAYGSDGRRLQLGTGTSCDNQVEEGKEYISNPGYTLSSLTIQAEDALACESNCVQNAICNFWSWEQVDDISGTCTHYSQVDDYVEVVSTTRIVVSGRCTPTRVPTSYHQPGTLEIWVSRSLALFGSRAAVIDTTRMHGGETSVYLHEGRYGEAAEGRYVYLRSFESNRQLRIDGLKLFVNPTPPGRRLNEETVEGGAREDADAKEAKEAKEAEDAGETMSKKTQKERDLEEDAKSAKMDKIPFKSQARIYKMRNLTMVTCLEETRNPMQSKDARQMAAFLWAELSEEESAIGCTSCLNYKPVNCTRWFQMPHGYRKDHSNELKNERRKMQEKLDNEETPRKESIRDSIGSGCCRINKRTGEKKCGREFCQKAIKKKAEQRMAHVLRKLHENPTSKTVLNTNQLVATDMVTPKLHHDPRCQTEKSRDDHGHIECISSSILKHLGDKHGFKQEDLDKKLERFGIKVADFIKAQIRYSSSDSPKKKYEFKSDPKKAHMKARIRNAEKNRRALSNLPESTPMRKGPKARWMKRSTKQGRRLLEGEPGEIEPLIGVERLALSPKDLRMRKKVHGAFVKNQSCAAKEIMRAANLASATSGAQPVTMSGLMNAAWDSSLASDSSFIGRAQSITLTLGKVAEKVESISKKITESRDKAKDDVNTFQRRTMRELSQREEKFFADAEATAVASGKKRRGYEMPAHIKNQYGWIAESYDWVKYYDEAHRLGRILYQRHEWVQQHAEETGMLPVGELPAEHKTGYSWLDINAPPSMLGSWVRAQFQGGTRHARHRNLKSQRVLTELPRQPPPEGYRHRSLIGAFMDASVNNEDPFDAAWQVLHYNNHHTNTRRLSDMLGWFVDKVQETAADGAEIVFGKATGTIPGTPNVPGTDLIDPLRQLGRYIVYDTLLCYLYAPPAVDGGPFGDGTEIELHYGTRACFPMSKPARFEPSRRCIPPVHAAGASSLTNVGYFCLHSSIPASRHGEV